MKLKQRLKASPDFSTSSMADLVFLLLIFFMLTSSFVSQAGVTIELPKSDSQKPSEGKNSVTITEDGRYFWNGNEAAANGEKAEKQDFIAKEIARVLTDEVEENNVITLRTDLAVLMEDAAFVMSEIAKNGGKVVIATEKK